MIQKQKNIESYMVLFFHTCPRFTRNTSISGLHFSVYWKSWTKNGKIKNMKQKKRPDLKESGKKLAIFTKFFVIFFGLKNCLASQFQQQWQRDFLKLKSFGFVISISFQLYIIWLSFNKHEKFSKFLFRLTFLGGQKKIQLTNK